MAILTTRSTLTAGLLALTVALMAIDPRPLAELIPGYRAMRMAAIGLVMAAILVSNAGPLSQAIRHLGVAEALVFAFAGYQCLSSFWSAAGPAAALQGGAYILMLLTALAIARGIPPGRFVETVALAILATSIAGALTALALPTWGQEHHLALSGSWRGLADQKNMFGALNAVLGLFCFVMMRARPYTATPSWFSRRGLLISFAFALLLAALSQSRGAIVFLFSSVLFHWLLTRRFHRAHIVAFSAACVALLIVTAVNVIGVAGDYVTLYGEVIPSSSRFRIWEYAFRDYESHSLIGYGAGGFWTENRYVRFMGEHGWALPNLHNGYVTILIEGGLIGATLIGSALLLSLNIIVRNFVQMDHFVYPISISFIAAFLINNMFESPLGQSLNPLTFLFFTLLFYGLPSYRTVCVPRPRRRR